MTEENFHADMGPVPEPVATTDPTIQEAVAKAIARFREEYVHKSFSQRHPELGRMVNCRACNLRHRTSEPCHKFFALSKRNPDIINATRAIVDCEWCKTKHRGHEYCPSELALVPTEERISLVSGQTRKGVLGAAMFAKKRFFPHHSQRLLQLVELTKKLFPKYEAQITDPEKAMHAARGEAVKVLFRRIRAKRKSVSR